MLVGFVCLGYAGTGSSSSQFLAERNAVLEQREFRLLLDFL